ncbi:MAG: nucleoside phosphorylase [Anaerolineaceae bacterium]
MAKTPVRADAPTDGEDRVYHLRLRKGEIPPYVVLTNDPANTAVIAKEWTDSRELAYNREYRTFSGSYQGTPLATTSSGIGCQSSELVINELLKVGATTCVKVGNVSSIDPAISLGDLIIPMACMRKGGTADMYVDPEYPAFPDITVEKALMMACDKLGYKYTLGINYSVSSFYIGQGRPWAADGSGYWPSWANRLIEDLQGARICSIDTDTAGQFIVSFLHEVKMGAILSVNNDRLKDTWGDNGGFRKATLVACEALKIMTSWDAKAETGKNAAEAK